MSRSVARSRADVCGVTGTEDRSCVETCEVERLIELYDACQRVTCYLSQNDAVLARAVQATCSDIERTLEASGLRIDDPDSETT
jgi:hypothetical protein